MVFWQSDQIVRIFDLWAILYSLRFLKIRDAAQILGPLFSTVQAMYKFWQKCIGLHFGRLKKLTWSPCILVSYTPAEKNGSDVLLDRIPPSWSWWRLFTKKTNTLGAEKDKISVQPNWINYVCVLQNGWSIIGTYIPNDRFTTLQFYEVCFLLLRAKSFIM
jgi:hypothetical protein